MGMVSTAVVCSFGGFVRLYVCRSPTYGWVGLQVASLKVIFSSSNSHPKATTNNIPKRFWVCTRAKPMPRKAYEDPTATKPVRASAEASSFAFEAICQAIQRNAASINAHPDLPTIKISTCECWVRACGIIPPPASVEGLTAVCFSRYH